MFKETKKGQTNSYPIVTIKKSKGGFWYIIIESNPELRGSLIISDAEIKELQRELNKKLK